MYGKRNAQGEVIYGEELNKIRMVTHEMGFVGYIYIIKIGDGPDLPGVGYVFKSHLYQARPQFKAPP